MLVFNKPCMLSDNGTGYHMAEVKSDVSHVLVAGFKVDPTRHHPPLTYQTFESKNKCRSKRLAWTISGFCMSVSSRTTQKFWVCLFACAVSRAVHLELVENQSAAEFHLALRRFFAMYGCPKLIASDNASQFITVDSAMKKLWSTLT
jgi:hypothetical protein